MRIYNLYEVVEMFGYTLDTLSLLESGTKILFEFSGGGNTHSFIVLYDTNEFDSLEAPCNMNKYDQGHLRVPTRLASGLINKILEAGDIKTY